MDQTQRRKCFSSKDTRIIGYLPKFALPTTITVTENNNEIEGTHKIQQQIQEESEDDK